MRTLGTLLLTASILTASYFGYKLFKPTLAGKKEATPDSEKTILDEDFDVAFSKIKSSDLYQTSGATKRLAIDSVISTVMGNKQAKQNLKIYSDVNKMPLETAIMNELLPKG